MNNEYYMPYRATGYTPSYLASNANTNTNIIWTMGAESAKAYPVMPGRTLLLMDSESSKFFSKSVDNNGFATLKSFSFQEDVPLAAATEDNKYVTQEQLQAAIAQLMAQMPTNDKPKNLL